MSLSSQSLLVLVPAITYGYVGNSLESLIPGKRRVVLPMIAATAALQATATLFFLKKKSTHERPCCIIAFIHQKI